MAFFPKVTQWCICRVSVISLYRAINQWHLVIVSHLEKINDVRKKTPVYDEIKRVKPHPNIDYFVVEVRAIYEHCSNEMKDSIAISSPSLYLRNYTTSQISHC